MRKYWEVIKITFKVQTTYRFDILINAVFSIAKIVLANVLWRTVFMDKDVVAGFTLGGMLTYYVISTFLAQLDMSDGTGNEMAARIRGGTFSRYMVVPMNVFGYFAAQTIGAAGFYMIFNTIALAGWVFLFRIPFAMTANPALLLSAVGLIFLGLLFMQQLHSFLGILAFKFQNISLFMMIKYSIVQFVTGGLIPLALLPEIVQSVLRIFPFYYVTYLPSMVLMGRNTAEIPVAFAVLIAWNAVLLLVNPLTYKRLRTRFDGVGI